MEVDFAVHACELEKAADLILPLVKQLREFAEVKKPQELNALLRNVEDESDAVVSASLKKLCDGQHDPLRVVIFKDLFEHVQKIIDGCCELGKLVLQTALKNG